jgi:ADP-ribose pyrophosphatase
MGVVILPVIEEKIIIHNHFRHATRSWHKEIIRGFGEPGTPAEIQARQEIKEEIEGEIETINDLGYLFPNTGIEGSVAKLFIAKLSKIGRLDVNEGISDLTLVSKMDFQNMIANGEINDGYTIAAYSRAQLKGFI